jgi:hypothetical protein
MIKLRKMWRTGYVARFTEMTISNTILRLYSSEMLHSVCLYLVTDLSGQHIDPTCKGQAHALDDYLILEDVTDMLSRNVGNRLMT